MELDEKQQFLVKALKDCHGTENIKNKQVIDLAAELPRSKFDATT